MAKKYYGVKQGRIPGVYETWEECREQVHGFPGATYKSFPTAEEAAQFVGQTGCENAPLPQETVNLQPEEPDALRVYVDGSYNSQTKEYSYGMVVLADGKELTFNRKFSDAALAQMHNVAGEIKGAEAAMQYALEHGYSRVVIYHDYEGIAKWCLGEWKANKEGTKAYKAFYESASRQVQISFVKVTGHSNDYYNDMADKLAKAALGLQ